jgi:hemolysin III
MPIVAASARTFRRLRHMPERAQHRSEEIANALSHGVGAVLAAVGSGCLLAKAFAQGDALLLVACAAYCGSLLAVMTASAGSHWIADPRRKRRWEVWDQATIFLLIAGTYSPYASMYLRDGWWPAFTLAMWLGALLGFWSKIRRRPHAQGIGLSLYLALGWLPVVCLPTVFARMDAAAATMTVVGGLCYTLGAAFLAFDHWAKYLHLCWHLLVLCGCTLHFATVYGFVGR